MSSELVEIKKEQHVMTREETIWYSSEAKDTEVMTRVIFWNDFDDIIYELGGSVKYWVYNKRLYNKLLEYFNLEKNNTYWIKLSLTSSEPIKFTRCTDKENESSNTDEPVRCSYDWFRSTTYRKAFGNLEFTTSCKNTLEKIVSFVMKFEP